MRRASLLFVLLACSKTPAGPTLTSFVPATGTVGTIATINGSGLVATPKVTFVPVGGGSSCDGTVTTMSAPSSLDVKVPDCGAKNADGTVFDVKVTNPDGGATTLAKVFTMKAPALTDLNGGRVGSGTVGSLFIADGSGFGDLAAAPASGYSVDFRDAGSGAVVATAAVDFANGNWQDIFIVATVPGSLAASTTYNVTVTTPSGTSNAVGFLVTSAVSFSPSTIQWTATSSLPAPLQGLSAVVANGTLYALGGNDGAKTANVTSVSYDPITPATGALTNAAWTASTALPNPRGFAAAVSASSYNSLVSGNGNLYVLGGLDETGAPTTTVFTAPLNADGSVGAWTSTTALPLALFGMSAVIFHGRIYLAGGNDSSGAPSAKTYSAHIKADGTLEAWQTLPDLPAAVAYNQLVTSGGSLYVLGGTNSSSVDPVSKTQSSAPSGAIYDAAINIRNGSIAAWGTNASAMGKSREKFSAVAAGSFILVSGGLYNGAGSGSSEQSYASINSDGSIASFNGATGSHTISGAAGGYDFFNHAAVLFVDSAGNPHVIVVGGEDTNAGTPVAGVWYQH